MVKSETAGEYIKIRNISEKTFRHIGFLNFANVGSMKRFALCIVNAPVHSEMHLEINDGLTSELQ